MQFSFVLSCPGVIFFATSTFLHCSSFHGSLKTPSGTDIPAKVSAPFVHLVCILFTFKMSIDTYNLCQICLSQNVQHCLRVRVCLFNGVEH